MSTKKKAMLWYCAIMVGMLLFFFPVGMLMLGGLMVYSITKAV
jgi:hypothetical protein